MCCAVTLGCSALTSLKTRCQSVGLVAHQNFAARGTVEFGVRLAIFKRVADDALDALARVDVFLGGDLVGSSLLEHTARIGVDALGVFAEDDEIHVLGLDPFQRTQRGIEQAHRPYVGVQVHFEAHAKQNFLGVDVRLDAGVSERADEDGIEIAGQHRESVRRNCCLVAQVTVRTPVEIG